MKVTDEEATQKHMQYVEFDYSTTSDSSSSSDTTVSGSGKEKNQRDGRGICQRCKDSRRFCCVCNGTGNRSQRCPRLILDSVSPSKEVVKAADKLGEGETTDAIEGDTACYVAKVTSLNDKNGYRDQETVHDHR